MKAYGNWASGFSVHGSIQTVKVYHSMYDLLESFLPNCEYGNDEDFCDFLRNEDEALDYDTDFLLIDDNTVLYVGLCGVVQCVDTISEILQRAVECYKERE